MHKLTIYTFFFCISDLMHCTNEFVFRNFRGIIIYFGYEFIFGAVSFIYMHINGCVLCVYTPFKKLWLHVNTPIDLYSTKKNRLTQSLYNKDYETLNFCSHSFSLIFCISLLMQNIHKETKKQNTNNKNNTERYRRHIYFFWLLLFFGCFCCCCIGGYRHTTLAQKICGAIKLPNKK